MNKQKEKIHNIERDLEKGYQIFRDSIINLKELMQEEEFRKQFKKEDSVAELSIVEAIEAMVGVIEKNRIYIEKAVLDNMIADLKNRLD